MGGWVVELELLFTLLLWDDKRALAISSMHPRKHVFISLPDQRTLYKVVLYVFRLIAWIPLVYLKNTPTSLYTLCIINACFQSIASSPRRPPVSIHSKASHCEELIAEGFDGGGETRGASLGWSFTGHTIMMSFENKGLSVIKQAVIVAV